MTRDEVKSIIKDITDEQLNGLMDLNSRDIGKAKGESDDQKAGRDHCQSRKGQGRCRHHTGRA